MAASGDASRAQQISELMKDPKMMAALQARLGDLEGMRSPFFDSLPKNMKNRVYAIRNIQKEYIHMESEFYNEVNKLEQKFHQRYSELYKRREAIISAKYEPTEEECLHSDDDDEDDEDETKENRPKETPTEESMTDDLEPPFPADTKGVPEFWSTVLRSANTTGELVDEADEPILKELTDITLTYLTPEEAQTEDQKEGVIGFKLHFHFNENAYFEDKVLTKTYKLRMQPLEGYELTYEGPEIIECIGHDIKWKSNDMNVTKKLITKKQKNKKTGQTRVITNQEAKESFFNYFSSIEDKLKLVKDSATGLEDELEDEDPEEQENFMREADYEIGHFIRERLIPRAVLYYTGELNDEEEDEDDYEDDEDEDLEDEDGEEDPDFDPSKAKEQPECKQQ